MLRKFATSNMFVDDRMANIYVTCSDHVVIDQSSSICVLLLLKKVIDKQKSRSMTSCVVFVTTLRILLINYCSLVNTETVMNADVRETIRHNRCALIESIH